YDIGPSWNQRFGSSVPTSERFRSSNTQTAAKAITVASRAQGRGTRKTRRPRPQNRRLTPTLPFLASRAENCSRIAGQNGPGQAGHRARCAIIFEGIGQVYAKKLNPPMTGYGRSAIVAPQSQATGSW